MDKKKINPYIEALTLIKNRLLFDLRFSSFGNRKKLARYKDKHLNEKAIIVCNGPSLKYVNFDEIQESGIFTIGLNKINLLFDTVKYRPNIIVAINEMVIEQNFDFYYQTEIPVFLDYDGIKRAGKLDQVNKIKNFYMLHTADMAGRFAEDVSESICAGYTVTYAAMQIAFHLGFKEVAVIGCDHNFVSQGTANKLIEQKGQEDNHFIPNYFSPGSKWHLPDLLGSEFHYQIARDTYLKNDRALYNCTEGGKLELFERRKLSEFLKK